MKIAFLLQDASRIYGEEQAMLDLVRGLVATGKVDARALLLREIRLGAGADALARAFADHGVATEVFDVKSAFSPGLIGQLRGYIKAEGIQVLHTCGYKAGVHGGIGARFGQFAPVVGTVHGWLRRGHWKERLYEKCECHALRKMQRVIVLSRYYEKLLRAEGVPGDKLVRIPSGIDIEHLQADPERRAEGPFTVGTLGRLSAEKNQALLVDAMSRVHAAHPGLVCRIGGEGDLQEALGRDIAARQAGDYVRLEGYLDRRSFFPEIHAFVLTSTIENLPYTILEAMAWARPVIATRAGGIPDLVDSGVTGYLVEPGDAGELAGRIGELAADPERAEAMGRAGREKFEREFNLAVSVRAHLEVYGQLC